jgi:acyl-CoA thioester hydrolase
MRTDLRIDDFPSRTSDKLRYADTDRQGHVNNAVFATFAETGRVEILYDPQRPLTAPGTEFVVAQLSLDYLSELRWPGEVLIGTRVVSIGRSSVQLEQGLFQNGRCAATTRTTVVLIDSQLRKSSPLPPQALERFRGLMAPQEAPAAQ